MDASIDIQDIQGIILRGYSNLPAAQFLLLTISDAAAAKKWLSLISKTITPGNQKPDDAAAQIAFTYAGLQALGLNQATLNSFPLELEDGMTTSHKQLFLGDFDKSCPDNWIWGNSHTPAVHILLMLYAKDATTLAGSISAYRQNFSSYGIQEIQSLDTTVLHDRKEHFGFHDGISQPTIKGLSRADYSDNCVEIGEFVLGYKNEYGQYTPRPFVPAGSDAAKMLAPMPANTGYDLGMNGSYIVFRQLKQDVSLFWKYMAKATQETEGIVNESGMVKFASQIVGRWPDGTSLVISPDEENSKMQDNNNFDYRHADPHGLNCPFAAHVRRTNPRDSLDTNRALSIAISKKHRLLRRGRSYGPPLAETLKPIDCYNATKCDDDRGLHFICINADIARQFEFVQNSWVNNKKFNGLYDERDPLIGNHHNPQDDRTTGTFCVQHDGLRTRLTDIPEFVKVVGGAYFFLPGMRALNYLANF